MYDHERRQLVDELNAKTVRFKDLSGTQLKALKEDWSLDYTPDFDFFDSVMTEMERRETVMSGADIMTAVNKNFFGVKK